MECSVRQVCRAKYNTCDMFIEIIGHKATKLNLNDTNNDLLSWRAPVTLLKWMILHWWLLLGKNIIKKWLCQTQAFWIALKRCDWFKDDSNLGPSATGYLMRQWTFKWCFQIRHKMMQPIARCRLLSFHRQTSESITQLMPTWWHWEDPITTNQIRYPIQAAS